MAKATLALLVLLLPLSAYGEGVSASTELSEETFPAIRKALLLRKAESTWQEIPWRPDLGVAIYEARKADKPILLWMMNGHPCGMT